VKLFSIPIIVFTIYIFYRTSISDHRIFPLSFIFLLLGLVFESFRVLESWKSVYLFLLGSYLFSLVGFLPGKHESTYSFESHLEPFPYIFLICYTFGFALFKIKETTERLTEGITLLLSIAFIYWVIDHNIWNIDIWFIKCLVIISLIFSLFSVIGSLMRITLSKRIRLTLSIWSSIILLLFAIENIYGVYQNQDIETSKYFSQGLSIAVQFFLLGVSGIYIAQNTMMILEFLPGKETFFNSVYFKELKDLENRHIERYSAQQINPRDSLITIVLLGSTYILNYKFNFLPRQTLIWSTFVLVPLFFRLVYQNKKVENLPPT
jgi:hypothetical protein